MASSLAELRRQRLSELRDRLAAVKALEDEEREARALRYVDDPVLWVEDRLGEHVWSKQAEVLRAVRDHKLTAVQSSHGIGKSHIASRIVAYYLDNYPPGDFFVVTTAPTWAQIRAILWRYIGQMHTANDLPGYVTQQAEWKIGDELVAYGRKPADSNDQGMQGLHARRGVIAVIDEASGVDEQIWNAVDSLATTPESRIIALGNPDSQGSRFHRVCTSEPGWHRIKVSSFDTPAWTGEDVPDAILRGLVSREWVEDKALRWGENSTLYRVKVLGEFADDVDGLIPYSWVSAAQQRWQDYMDALAPGTEPPGRSVFGVDVATTGDDVTCIARKQGPLVYPLERWATNAGPIEVAELVRARLHEHPKSEAIVDAIGEGKGTYEALRRWQCQAHPFVASAGTKVKDSSGTQTPRNLRSLAWWTMREALDPRLGATLCLPPDDDLAAELTAPRYELLAGAKIAVESKDGCRKRLGRSTDAADAVVQAVYGDGRPQMDLIPGEKPRQPRRAVAYAHSPSW